MSSQHPWGLIKSAIIPLTDNTDDNYCLLTIIYVPSAILINLYLLPHVILVNLKKTFLIPTNLGNQDSEHLSVISEFTEPKMVLQTNRYIWEYIYIYVNYMYHIYVLHIVHAYVCYIYVIYQFSVLLYKKGERARTHYFMS